MIKQTQKLKNSNNDSEIHINKICLENIINHLLKKLKTNMFCKIFIIMNKILLILWINIYNNKIILIKIIKNYNKNKQINYKFNNTYKRKNKNLEIKCIIIKMAKIRI